MDQEHLCAELLGQHGGILKCLLGELGKVQGNEHAIDVDRPGKAGGLVLCGHANRENRAGRLPHHRLRGAAKQQPVPAGAAMSPHHDQRHPSLLRDPGDRGRRLPIDLPGLARNAVFFSEVSQLRQLAIRFLLHLLEENGVDRKLPIQAGRPFQHVQNEHPGMQRRHQAGPVRVGQLGRG